MRARTSSLRPSALSRWLAIGAVMVACARNRPSEEDLALAAALREADAAWAARGRAGLDPVALALEEVPPARRAVPEVRWRWVRLRIAEGLVASDRATGLRSLAAAREEGLRCLTDDSVVRSTAARAGWVSAAPLIEESRVVCAAWASLAWSRWAVAFGAAGASVDADNIGALTSRGLAAADVDVHDVASWAEALRLLTMGVADQDRRRGVAMLLDVVRRGDDRDDAWVRWWDAARALEPSERGAFEAPTRPPSTPEERVTAVLVAKLSAREQADGTP
jgi:hypothetical protein